ncbi:MAG: hypothetical protein BMS9Abin26_1109 [Gammaproteobacteria bacterium]|nr:MAG: hypothetical protein BMS9Abin26_1109 [Gammaproteobacteria bacterium]
MSEKKKFAERLNAALDFAGIPKKGMGRQSALVKMLGASHRSAKKWLDGGEFPPTSKLVKLSQITGVRSNWLLSGQGDMISAVSDDDDSKKEIAQEASVMSQEAFDIATDWMKLPESQRIAIRKVIHELVKNSV